MKTLADKLLIGRNEWCGLPALSLPYIKAKIDTGAKTSAIHAFNIQPFTQEGTQWVSFDIHPLQAINEIIISCQSPVIDERKIMSSNGHMEERYIIRTPIVIGDKQWAIDISLSNRDPLRFRMLLGREALCKKTIIDPNMSCHQLTVSRKKSLLAYSQR